MRHTSHHGWRLVSCIVTGLLVIGSAARTDAEEWLRDSCPDDIDADESGHCGYVGYRYNRRTSTCEYSGPVCTREDVDDGAVQWGRLMSCGRFSRGEIEADGSEVTLQWMGHCVKGELHGTLTSQMRTSINDQNFLVDLKAQYRYGILTGAQTQTIVAVSVGGQWVNMPGGPLLVAATCDGEVFQSCDAEGCTEYQTRADGERVEASNTPHHWFIDIKDEVPTMPAKPVLEDFVENAEKPELELPEAPVASDYESRADFRDAMQSHYADVAEAKAQYAEAMAEYRAAFRAQRAEATAKLKEAMVEYNEAMREFKADMASVRQSSALLASAVAACPRVTSAYCKAATECYTEGECHLGGFTEAGEAVCVAKSAADCKQSSGCRDAGKCKFDDGSCVLAE